MIGQTIGPGGKTMGSYNDDVEFGDGEVKEYAANVIAENLLNQVDDEGFTITHLQAIVDYRKNDTALAGTNAFATTKRGETRIRKTTHGWDLLV
jgi:hypothetical protein